MANIETLLAATRYFEEAAAPGTPAAGGAVLYVKTDGNIYFKNDAGVECQLSIGAAWTTWVPALTAATTNPTLGTGSTAGGIYVQQGKLVIARFALGFGTSGAAAGTGEYYVSLPVTSTTANGNNMGGISLFDNSTVTSKAEIATRQSSTTVKISNSGVAGTSFVTAASPWTWAASDTLQGLLIYEAA